MSITIEFLKHFPGKQIFVSKTDGQGLDPKLPTPPPIHYHSEYQNCNITLHKQESVLWGTFFTVNELDRGLDPKHYRTTKMVTRIRAVWVEDDKRRKAKRTDFPIKPNLIVTSSPGKYHYYWLTNTNRFDEWKGVMATMVDEYGSDANAKDLCRILRLPGFKHNKAKPFDVVFEVLEEKPYSWSDIVRNFPIGDVTSSSTSKSKKTEVDNVKAIITGENFHGSFQSIAASMANRTLHKPTILQQLRGIGFEALFTGDLSEERKATLTEVLSNDTGLKDVVDWAVDETLKEREEDEENVSLPDVPKEEHHKYEIEWPPGLIGKLCKEIYEMAPHPNREVAIAAGLGIIAGVAGRKYNVNGMGLNLYITLLADSGIGKANLKNSINRILVNSKNNMKGASYKGPSRFTGPKAVFDILANGMSRVCVLEEAGLLGQSSAGDQAGITRALLDLYTSSGVNEYAGGESYSDSKNNVPLLRSPSLTAIFVSTPKSYLENLKSKNSDVSGETARLFSIRVERDKEYLNKNMRKNFSDEVQSRLDSLMKLCVDRQSVDSSSDNVVHIDVQDVIMEKSDNYTDSENEHKRSGDNLRRTVTSRAFAKSLKISSVISVFNDSCDQINMEAWEWAESAVAGELENISETFTVDASDDIMKIAKSVIGVSIINILHHKFKDRKKQVDVRMRKKGIVTKYAVNQVLKNNSNLKDMDDPMDRTKPKKGIDKVLEYMIDNGLLTKVKKDELTVIGSRVSEAYKITYEFKLMFDE